MAKKTKAPKRDRPRERLERRFEPRSGASSARVYVLGGLGAMAMGAGAWGQFGPLVREGGPDPFRYASYLLVAGAVLVGIALWFGTSGEPVLRVGDAGVATEKGGLHRMPWYAIESITWRDGAVRASGKDDLGVATTIVASLASHPQAAAWMVKEGRQRLSGVVDVPADVALPAIRADAGDVIALQPPQIVGKHCAASGKVIAYEPDARICGRCERVYHNAHVPESCACGASLLGLRLQPKTA